jgi:hypothetical protein
LNSATICYYCKKMKLFIKIAAMRGEVRIPRLR